MRYDFSDVDDKQSFATVPPGVYLCRVAEVREGHSRDGSERWSLRLEVATGDLAGRTAAWDSLTWSERGVVRVKRVLEALGFDVTGELEVEPASLKDLRARVQLVLEDWEDPVTGKRQERLTVPFLGWGPAVEDDSAPAEGSASAFAESPF